MRERERTGLGDRKDLSANSALAFNQLCDHGESFNFSKAEFSH